MYTSSPASSVLLLAALTQVCQGYWRMNCGVVQTGRIDPVVSPGKIASHVHKISGPSNIGLNSTYDSLRSASCTSCAVQADKSAYWTPQLYYHHSNGSFEEVPNSGHVIYYLGRGDNRTNIQSFPPGFRMLSGDAGARSYDNATFTFGGTTGATYVNGTVGSTSLTGGTWVNDPNASGRKFYGRPVSDRTSFNCLDASPLPETPNIVRTNCTNGLRAQIHFQSCWDGINLYKSDNSHVAYMSQIDNGVCPPGYPVQFVHLFYEVLYGTNNIKLDGGQFVFAQGDTTGYGFHADFLNGWDMPTQTAALSQCANTDNGGQISACAPLAATDSSESGTNCPQQPALINEPARGMISKLPGCINITSGPNAATSADMICPASVSLPSVNPTPASTGPTVTFLPSAGNVYNNWKYMGCANDTGSGRTLTGASYTDNSGMTNEACQSFCASKNYPIAATEFGSQCYCGLALDPSASLLGQTCNGIICSGNRSEICGGSARMSVWNSTTYKGPYKPFPSAAGVTLDSSVYLGCATDNGGPRTLAAASYSDSTGMTLNTCQSFCAAKNYPIWGTEYTSECYCAPSLPSLSVLTDPSTCSMPCANNSSQICGGPRRLTLFNNTAIHSAPSAPAPNTLVGSSSIYLGCASEASSGRALSAASYSDNGMTNAVCASYCASNNFNLFGTEYGRECYCGNSLAAGASLGQTGCSVPCAGTLPSTSPFTGYANTCGGPGRLSLWNNTAYQPVQTVASVGKYVSKGCYAEGTKGRALASASWAAPNMTVEACVGFCSGKGWGYAGVEYSQECYCGSGISNGGAPAAGGCGMLCKGDALQYCGGPGKLNVYSNG